MENIIFNILLPLIGGLALFMFGMDEMGGGLEKVAGGSLERILAKLTNSPIKGVLLGMLVTAVIQSSSATTVMVVGFVNSGIMALSQAISVILGANIGTTATAWILSTASLSGDEWFVEIFTPKVFWIFFAAIGVVIIMTAKKQSKRMHIGRILIGFGVLMFGMQNMSNAMKEVPEEFLKEIFLTFSNNPILGLIAGAVLTAVIQSSSASVGILQSIAIGGGITFGGAFPIIMGQNIGTCITALLSSMGANKNAKRASMAHLYFNLIGSVLFMIVFYGANAILNFSFINENISAVDIALVHTIFNITCTIVFFPFIKALEKLATITVRGDKKEEIDELDERLFNTPSVALSQALEISKQMFKVSAISFNDALGLIGKYDKKTADAIEEYESQTDKYEDKLGSYLVKLSSYELLPDDSNEASMLLHNIGDFERIGDHALNIANLSLEMKDKQIEFSSLALQELAVVKSALREIVEITEKAFDEENLELAYEVEPLEQVIDHLIDEIRSRHIYRLQNGECTVTLGFIFSDMLINMERVSDHCSNIAACLITAKESSNYDTHKLMSKAHKHEEGFLLKQKEYEDKYALPALEK